VIKYIRGVGLLSSFYCSPFSFFLLPRTITTLHSALLSISSPSIFRLRVIQSLSSTPHPSSFSLFFDSFAVPLYTISSSLIPLDNRSIFQFSGRPASYKSNAGLNVPVDARTFRSNSSTLLLHLPLPYESLPSITIRRATMFGSVSTKLPARLMPRPVSKVFGSCQRPTTSTTNSISQQCRRWNGSVPPISNGKVAKQGPRWSWSRQIIFGAGTAALAYALAVKVVEDKHVKGRVYSNPDKFKGPKYASIQDMESVRMNCTMQNENSASILQ